MNRLFIWLGYAFIIILAIAWISPVILVLMNATKSLVDFNKGTIWSLPTDFQFFQNVRDALNVGGLGKGFISSFSYGVLGGIFSILLAALAAYGLVFLRLKGSFYWFLLIYSGAIFPFQMYLVPLFKAYQKLHIYNTFFGMLLFYIAICIPFCVFLLRNYMNTLSHEIVEAASLDGSNSFGVFTKIIFPQLIPPISVLFLFQFTWIWNDLIFGLTLTRNEAIRPIMAGLAAMQGMFFTAGITTLMAGIVITSLPTLILFILLQRNFIKGMQFSVKN